MGITPDIGMHNGARDRDEQDRTSGYLCFSVSLEGGIREALQPHPDPAACRSTHNIRRILGTTAQIGLPPTCWDKVSIVDMRGNSLSEKLF
jgi:hypothetical protein